MFKLKFTCIWSFIQHEHQIKRGRSLHTLIPKLEVKSNMFYIDLHYFFWTFKLPTVIQCFLNITLQLNKMWIFIYLKCAVKIYLTFVNLPFTYFQTIQDEKDCTKLHLKGHHAAEQILLFNIYILYHRSDAQLLQREVWNFSSEDRWL